MGLVVISVRKGAFKSAHKYIIHIEYIRKGTIVEIAIMVMGFVLLYLLLK